MVFWGSAFLCLQTWWVELMSKTIIWPHHIHSSLRWIISVFSGKPQMGLYMCLLEQEDFGGTPGSQYIMAKCVTNGFLGDVVPVPLRSLTSSSRVILGWSLTLLRIILNHKVKSWMQGADGHITKLCRPEFLLVGRKSNTFFSGFFVGILALLK